MRHVESGMMRLRQFVAVLPAAALPFVVPLGTVAQPDDGHTRTIEIWADEGMTQNPVAIAFDHKGRLMVAESDRAGVAVLDTRNLAHLDAVVEDMRLRSVGDRLAQMQRWTREGHFEPGHFRETEDRIRLLEDTDGDGTADRTSVFAGGFNDPLDGIASGVLWHDGTVYFTNIPHLWALRDRDDDGVADEREVLSTGYGIRWCFYGHDLHGLVMGPDGRLYFSLGDRGYNIETPEGNHYVGVDRGAVFRCWPDGRSLELVHEGLRNPQELAFDDLGNLFTGDNNSDSGDRARIVHIVEGGDSGWRQNVQSLGSRGPWNRERMWELRDDMRDPLAPAWSLPPIAHVSAGPSGFEFYPGTGESASLDRHFMLVDFRGSKSVIHTFMLEPEGAWFRLDDLGTYYDDETTYTDIAWGADGRLYCSDWGGGWSPNPNGRVLVHTNRTVREDPAERAVIDATAALLRSGFDETGGDSLVALLTHRDRRVRQGSQFELASRGASSIAMLAGLLSDTGAPLLGRLHALWGLSQIARQDPDASVALVNAIADTDPVVCAQAVKFVSDLGTEVPAETLLALLRDPSGAVRYEAACALGRMGHAPAIPALLRVLAENDGLDPILRHGASRALAGMRDEKALLSNAVGSPVGARVGIVLALRMMGSPAVAEFMDDPDVRVAAEAVRAVYDLRDTEVGAGADAWPLERLAALLSGAWSAERSIEPIVRRAIAANVLLADEASAARLAQFAADERLESGWRGLALERLRDWDRPLQREGVWGDLIEFEARSAGHVQRAVRSHLMATSMPDEAGQALLDGLRLRHGTDMTMDELVAMVGDASASVATRRAAIDTVARFAPDRLAGACEMAVRSDRPGLRMHAMELMAERRIDGAFGVLERAIERGNDVERRRAVRGLQVLGSDEADERLAVLARTLASVESDPTIALDVFEASRAAARGSAASIAVYNVAWDEPGRDGYRASLVREGGDPDAGRRVFFDHDAAQCLRCHAVDGVGGVVGPDLSAVALRLDGPGLVSSVLTPNAEVTPGYGSVSAMPEMTGRISAGEMRDVIAYLRTLRNADADPAALAGVGVGGGGLWRAAFFGLVPYLLIVSAGITIVMKSRKPA